MTTPNCSNSAIGVFESIPINQIRHSRHRVRDGGGAIDELISSIRENGLLEPLLVRPIGPNFEVIAGNRRLEACVSLRMRRVGCHVVVLDDRQAYLASLVENVQRESMNPLEEGIAFKRFVDDYGYGGISELARQIGKSQSYVSRRVSLLDLPSSVREDVVRGRISSVVAQELEPLAPPEAAMVAELVEKNELSRAEVRMLIRQNRAGASTYPLPHHQGDEYKDERRQQQLDRLLAKAVASTRICLLRLDDVIDSVADEEWVVKEALSQYRWSVHQVIDNIIRLKLRMHKYPPSKKKTIAHQSTRLPRIQNNRRFPPG